ncbi:TBC domain-containing protein [Smittium mucronatum]|uniref:TBC domain-containing protein n=1 Tax=Smittium mucronatum TaxID=133383 RepID=A0A1R0H4M0_9FUNG|nr:TBC domain-containing protein [Smittium mucronatum]
MMPEDINNKTFLPQKEKNNANEDDTSRIKETIFGSNDSKIDIEKLASLCFNGIGDSKGLRSISWRDFIRDLVSSRISGRKLERSKKHFSLNHNSQLEDSRNKSEEAVILQILRDVKRTLPENNFFKKNINPKKLRSKKDNNKKSKKKPTDSKAPKEYKNSLIFAKKPSIIVASSNNLRSDLKDLSPINRSLLENQKIKIPEPSYDPDREIIPYPNQALLADLACFAISKKNFNYEFKYGLATEFIKTPPITHLDIIARILFIYTCLNNSVGYVQGMNELVATFYYVLVNDAPTQEDRIAAEADTFYLLFNTLNGQTLDNFIKELDDDFLHNEPTSPLSLSLNSSINNKTTVGVNQTTSPNSFSNQIYLETQFKHRKKSSVTEKLYSMLGNSIFKFSMDTRKNY